MTDLSNAGTPPVLPSTSQLLKATAAALAIGTVIVVVAVLPAEYGVDPTGAGRVLGLTAMGELKHRAEAEAEAAHQAEHAAPAVANPNPTPADAPPASAASAAPTRADEVEVVLKPNESAEVKAVMKAGVELTYSWTADRGKLNYDFHGEPKGAAKDVYESYEKGTESKAEGTFVAPFEGTHGWYWKNRTSETITIRVKTSGAYESVKRM